MKSKWILFVCSAYMYVKIFICLGKEEKRKWQEKEKTEIEKQMKEKKIKENNYQYIGVLAELPSSTRTQATFIRCVSHDYKSLIWVFSVGSISNPPFFSIVYVKWLFQIIGNKDRRDPSTLHSVSATVHREASIYTPTSNPKTEIYSTPSNMFMTNSNPPSVPSTKYIPLTPNPIASLSKTLRPTPLIQAGVRGSSRLQYSEEADYAQIIKSRSPVKQMLCDYEGLKTTHGQGQVNPQQTYDYPPTHKEHWFTILRKKNF